MPPDHDQTKPNVRAHLKKYLGITWPGWTSIVIWSVILIVLSALTVRDFIPLLDEYKSNNFGTQITIVNRTQRPNDVTICVPYYSKAFWKICQELANTNIQSSNLTCNSDKCERMIKQSWDVWRKINFTRNSEDSSDLWNVINQLTEAVIKKLFEDNDGLEALSLNKSIINWNQPIVDAVWGVLDYYSCKDLAYMTANNDDCPKLDNSVIDGLTEKMLSELFNRVLKAVGVYLKTEACFQDGACRVVPLEAREGVRIRRDHLCFLLLPNSTQETFTYEIPHLANSMYASLPPISDAPYKRYAQTSFHIYGDSAPLYSCADCSNDNYALHSTSPVTETKGASERVVLEYSTEISVAEGRLIYKDACSLDSTAVVCAAKRHLIKTKNQCKCKPLALEYFETVHSDLPYCNKTLYQSCGNISNLKDDLTICNVKCEYTFPKWKKLESNVTSKPNKPYTHEFIVDIRTSAIPFVRFILVARETQEQFLSNVGGLASLYLGLSGLSACAFLFFCVDLIKHWIRLKKEPESKFRSSPALGLFRIKGAIQMFKNNAKIDNAESTNRDELDRLSKEVHELKDHMEQIKNDLGNLQQKLVETCQAMQAFDEKATLNAMMIKEMLANELEVIRRELTPRPNTNGNKIKKVSK